MNEQPTRSMDAEGIIRWRLNGDYHREDGPAYEHPGGHKEWAMHGKVHRIGGPAVEYADGGRCWFVNGERHREDGPACEWASGDVSYWLNGMRLSYEKWKAKCNPFNMAFINTSNSTTKPIAIIL